MARGENPGMVLSVQTALTYSESTPFGHASAGKDLVLSLDTSGNGVIGADGAQILGKFLDLDKNKVATYMVSGHPMILRKTAAGLKEGEAVICGGSGKIKALPGTKTAATNAFARGIVLEILETGDNGRVLVYMP